MSSSRRSSAPISNESQADLARAEREAREIFLLPEREALSVAFPFLGPLSPVSAKGAEAVADAAEDALIDPAS